MINPKVEEILGRLKRFMQGQDVLFLPEDISEIEKSIIPTDEQNLAIVELGAAIRMMNECPLDERNRNGVIWRLEHVMTFLKKYHQHLDIETILKKGGK